VKLCTPGTVISVGHFDELADDIDPHLYEVAHVVDGK
jgi:hypothetical protein